MIVYDSIVSVSILYVYLLIYLVDVYMYVDIYKSVISKLD